MAQYPFNRIVVPVEFDVVLDQTLAGENSFALGENTWLVATPATLQAMRLADELGAKIDLVHATPDLSRTAMYAGTDGAWTPGPAFAELEATSRRNAVGVLDQLAKRIFSDGRAQCHAASGRPFNVIMDFIASIRPDAVVLAASARGRLRRAFGHTADKVIRRAPCPVVVVPAGFE